MSEFTKGKWEIRQGGGIDELDILTTGSQNICYLFGYPVSRWDEQKANARLIVAAPEMYDWIERARFFLFDLKRYAQDEDEMRGHAEELNETYNELITTSDLMLVRIDGEEAEA